jgi:hypothetical protein
MIDTGRGLRPRMRWRLKTSPPLVSMLARGVAQYLGKIGACSLPVGRSRFARLDVTSVPWNGLPPLARGRLRPMH